MINEIHPCFDIFPLKRSKEKTVLLLFSIEWWGQQCHASRASTQKSNRQHRQKNAPTLLLLYIGDICGTRKNWSVLNSGAAGLINRKSDQSQHTYSWYNSTALRLCLRRWCNTEGCYVHLIYIHYMWVSVDFFTARYAQGTTALNSNAIERRDSLSLSNMKQWNNVFHNK